MMISIGVLGRTPIRGTAFLFYRPRPHCQTSGSALLSNKTASLAELTALDTYNLKSGAPHAGNVMTNSSKLPPELVSRLRELAHDLSNSIETIMQASYLLGQSKLEPHGKKWVQLIEEAAQDAAQINRHIREVLRGEK
jgi:signal transduction histidine kinase